MRRFIKFLAYFLILVSIALGYLFGCATADLRTAIVKDNYDTEKARVLLKKMSKAHGIEKWDSIQAYQVKSQDEFFGFIGKNSHPFTEEKVAFRLQFIPKTYNGRLIFDSGKRKDQVWGLQAWETYTQHPGKDIVFKKDKDITFWLPTYQYFVEFPMRIQKADIAVYAGESAIDGTPCEGILVSWKKADPQRDIDQYLIWVNKETYQIEKIEYTIREMYKFLTGSALFKDYKNFNGILIPTRFPVKSNLKNKGLLHEMRVLDVVFDGNLVEKILPDSNLKYVGDEKID